MTKRKKGEQHNINNNKNKTYGEKKQMVLKKEIRFKVKWKNNKKDREEEKDIICINKMNETEKESDIKEYLKMELKTRDSEKEKMARKETFG